MLQLLLQYYPRAVMDMCCACGLTPGGRSITRNRRASPASWSMVSDDCVESVSVGGRSIWPAIVVALETCLRVRRAVREAVGPSNGCIGECERWTSIEPATSSITRSNHDGSPTLVTETQSTDRSTASICRISFSADIDCSLSEPKVVRRLPAGYMGPD